MLWLQPHKCYHCCKTQDVPQHVSASVPILEDLARCRPKGRPMEPEPLTVADLFAARRLMCCFRASRRSMPEGSLLLMPQYSAL